MQDFKSPWSHGMKLWYRREVPRCRNCKRVFLTRYDRRKIGLCAKCEKANPPTPASED